MKEKAQMQSTITHIDKGAMRRILGVGDLFAVGYGDLGLRFTMLWGLQPSML